MANSKISALTSATTPLAGTEVLPVVQSGATKQVSVANLTAGRAVSAASLSLTTTPLAVGSGGTGTSTAFTAGSVLFAGASGVYSQNNANFFWDNTNIRVGIGTSTPWSQASILTPSGGTVGYFGVKDTVYGGDVRFGKASGINNNGVAGTWSNNDFLLYANSAEAARIFASGGVSIGNTTDPGATNLSVTGSVQSGNQIFTTISVGTINGSSGTATVTIFSGPGVTRQVGIDIFVTGYENTNGGAIYMKAQAIAGWASGSINKFGIGSTNFNESLGGNDYRGYAGASLSLANSGNDLTLTITNSGSSTMTNVVVTLQIHYS